MPIGLRFPQDALAAAAVGGVSEIRVGQGTYTADRDEAGGVTPGDRAATFHLLDGVSLRGGYAGFGAADPDARDVTVYETVLSGDLTDPGSIVDNTSHIVTATETDATAVLDGFTIAHGYAGWPGGAQEGAGILITNGAATIHRGGSDLGSRPRDPMRFRRQPCRLGGSDLVLLQAAWGPCDRG